MSTDQPECRTCGHRVFLKGSRLVPPSLWRFMCLSDGCLCALTYCRPIKGGSTTRKEQTMSTPQQNADDFLMGGGGAPSAKFDAFGATVAGHITEHPEVQQQRDIKTGEKKFWSDGNAMMQLVVTVQTDLRDPAVQDDDGRRRLFIKGQMKTAIQEAVKAVGGRGLEVGGHLSITYTHDGVKSNTAFSAPKQYRAQYTAAATAELLAPAAPAPQQYAAPTPAPQYAAAAPVPQQYAAPAPAVPGLTAQQLAAAQADPATAALLAQLQAQQAAAPAAVVNPPF